MPNRDMSLNNASRPSWAQISEVPTVKGSRQRPTRSGVTRSQGVNASRRSVGAQRMTVGRALET